MFWKFFFCSLCVSVSFSAAQHKDWKQAETVSLAQRPSTRKHSFAFSCESSHVLHRLGQPSTQILKTQWLKTHFFENGSQGGKIRKRSPPVLVWTVNLHPKRWRHHPSPRPLASDLWTPRHLITTTTTADYCLCSCFLQLTRFALECESQQQFNLINSPHKRLWFPSTSHFLLLLLVFRFSFYCLFVNSMQV